MPQRGNSAYFYPTGTGRLNYTPRALGFLLVASQDSQGYEEISPPKVFYCFDTENKLRGLSPRANYTDRATAACRPSNCQLFADRGRYMVSLTDPYGRILNFLDKSRYCSIK
jgi:hypothetical protein